jgi:GDP-L-fucose synthase
MRLEDARVLVTGASGMIGSHLVAELARRGVRVRATVHQQEPRQRHAGVEYVKADLTQARDCVAVMEGMDLVFHGASVVVGAAATVANPLATLTSASLVNLLILDAAYRAGVKKFLWLGSTVAYPDAGARPLKEEEAMEGEPFEKYFTVGWMKRHMEVLCRIYGEKISKPMTTLVLRPTNVYGPGDKFDPAKSHVSAALLRKVVERQKPIEVWGTGDDVRDLIYVDDVVRAMILAMERLERYTTLNIGLGKGYSVKEILGMLLEIDGYGDAQVIFDPAKPTMIPVRLVDVSKAERLLGFKPEVSLREGLARTIAWFKKNRP